MTVSQALDYLRNRFNETDSSTSYWSDAELFSLMTGRAQQISGILGMIEVIDTSTTTVASTQSYAWPSTAAAIYKVLYDGTMLSEITFREWERDKGAGGTTPEGTPTSFVSWNRQVILIPIPNAANTLTFYYEKLQPVISTSSGTIDIPEALHFAMMDGVLADMFSKYQNFDGATFYENKWTGHMQTTFRLFKHRAQQRGKARILIDADTALSTGHGAR